MSTVTLVKCDGCGVQVPETPQTIHLKAMDRRERKPRSFAEYQAWDGRAYPAPDLGVITINGVEVAGALDYCSAECAAKHLGGAAK